MRSDDGKYIKNQQQHQRHNYGRRALLPSEYVCQ
jgi:hypothetical protein